MRSIHTPIRDIVPPHIRAQVEAHRLRYESDQAYRDECETKWSADWEAQREAAEAKLREDRARALVLETANRLLESRIPRAPADHLSDHFETDALKVAIEFSKQDDKTILILGGSKGVGKTIACCVAAWQTLGSVRFVLGMDLVRHGTYDTEFWADLENTNALVVDELGAEPLDEKGWALANILDLLHRRSLWRRKTWITLNLPIEPFFARYGTDGERLRDKLRECGRYVEVKGKSLRR